MCNNNVKALVWQIVSGANRPITVVEVIQGLGNVAPHSVYGAFISLRSEKMVIEIPSRAGKTYKKSDLAFQKDRALQVLMANRGRGFKRNEIANAIGCSDNRAYQVLEELVDAGWINRVGGNKFVHYFYGDELVNADAMAHCARCERCTLHKKNGKGKIMCVECSRQRKAL